MPGSRKFSHAEQAKRGCLRALVLDKLELKHSGLPLVSAPSRLRESYLFHPVRLAHIHPVRAVSVIAHQFGKLPLHRNFLVYSAEAKITRRSGMRLESLHDTSTQRRSGSKGERHVQSHASGS